MISWRAGFAFSPSGGSSSVVGFCVVVGSRDLRKLCFENCDSVRHFVGTILCFAWIFGKVVQLDGRWFSVGVFLRCGLGHDQLPVPVAQGLGAEVGGGGVEGARGWRPGASKL